MKRNSIVIVILALFSYYVVSGQNIPNRGFEEWEVRNLYEKPTSWFTSNAMTFGMGGEVINVTKTEDSFSGDYAIKLETVVSGEDTIMAYAVVGGMIIGGEGVRDLDYVGGFAFTEKPDLLIGYFKYHIEENDTAFIIVTFRKNGAVLAENYFLLFGNQENYTEIGFELDTLLETPDSAFFAISSTHPDSPVAGSWVIADSLHFSNTTANIPNGSLESWEMLTYEDPAGWKSVNWFSVITGSDISAIRTDEAYSGDYALMMTTIHLNMLEQNVGIITPGNLFVGGFSGGFPYDEVPSGFSGYYRFLPMGNDSAQVLMAFSKYNSVSDETEIVADYSFKLPARPVYTYFEEELSLGDIEIDTINIIILSSHEVFGESGNAPEGSILYMDDLWLESLCSYADTAQLFVFEDTTICTNETLYLDPGPGFVTYTWCDTITDRVLTVTESGTYRIEVTDDDGCVVEDQVVVSVEPCTHGNTPNSLPPLKVYPNPASQEIIIEISVVHPEEMQLTVLNLLGQSLYSEEDSYPSGITKKKIDLSTFSPGIYFVRLRSGPDDAYVRFIKR